MQESEDAFIKDRAYSHLTSRDPSQFWTSGQWMTERQGGSDVGEGHTHDTNLCHYAHQSPKKCSTCKGLIQIP